jgi:hypothetical protein
MACRPPASAVSVPAVGPPSQRGGLTPPAPPPGPRPVPPVRAGPELPLFSIVADGSGLSMLVERESSVYPYTTLGEQPSGTLPDPAHDFVSCAGEGRRRTHACAATSATHAPACCHGHPGWGGVGMGGLGAGGAPPRRCAFWANKLPALRCRVSRPGWDDDWLPCAALPQEHGHLDPRMRRGLRRVHRGGRAGARGGRRASELADSRTSVLICFPSADLTATPAWRELPSTSHL